jgi:hypothetical protein
MPTIEEAKALQARLNLEDVHVVWLDDLGFVIAHTDEERATIDLQDCGLHLWLEENGMPDELEDGWYIARRHMADGYSESYRSATGGLYDFERLIVGLP